MPGRGRRTLPVSARQHARAWLLRHRLKVKTLGEVIEQALDALEDQEELDG